MSAIHISSDNFSHNINQIAQRTKSISKIALVLKDNAYGHGVEVIAHMALKKGIRHIVVRNLSEAKIAGDNFETVLILSEISQKSLPKHWYVTINELDQIDRICPKNSVELKIDTGMHRSGISCDDFFKALEMIEKRGLVLKGVMTHFRCADEMGSEYFWQKKRFDDIKKEAKKRGIENIRWHSCNSAALFRTAAFDEDIARVGIAAYGCLQMPKAFCQPDLKPVMSLWADRVASRDVTPAYRIGYGAQGRLKYKGRISTYDIGYGDGWMRGDATRPYVLPNNEAIIGRVSMDMFSLRGDEKKVCLFDDATKAAKQMGTIAYEILVRINPAVERVVI